MKSAPVVNKWPFILMDIVLVGLAAAVINKGPAPLALWQGLLSLAAVGLGGWFCALPFLKDHETALALTQTQELAGTVAQLRNLEQVRNQIADATGHWREVQEQSNKSVSAARELAERMRAEVGACASMLSKANDVEKNHLRLELDKFRRAEGEWLQVLVHILDHVHALHQAGQRSGQPALVAQLDHFQAACRDVVRRLGLVPFAATPGEPFKPEAHQLPDGKAEADATDRVAGTLALGFSYQGQVVRRAIVTLGSMPHAEKSPELVGSAASEVGPAGDSDSASAGQEQLPL